MAHILCEICTRGRYGTTLPATLQSIMSQSRRPDTVMIVDDNPPAERCDLSKIPFYHGILTAMASFMKVIVIPGKGAPQCNHEMVRLHEDAKELIWRVDDDECPEVDVLKTLEQHLLDPKVGAAAGLVLHPPGIEENEYASSQLEDIDYSKNIQWYRWKDNPVFSNVGHLHSSYLYRKTIAPFSQTLSAVGHSEETQHSIQIGMAGYRLVVDTSVVTWHYREPNGGIRSHSTECYQHDEANFKEFLTTLPVTYKKHVHIVGAQGIGDCFALLSVMPDIIKSWEGKTDAIHVFVKEPFVQLFSRYLSDTVKVFPRPVLDLWWDKEQHNIYCWIQEAQHVGTLAEAYKQRYSAKQEEVK